MQTVPQGTTAGLWWSSLYTVYTLNHAKNLRKVRAMSLSLLNFHVLGVLSSLYLQRWWIKIIKVNNVIRCY